MSNFSSFHPFLEIDATIKNNSVQNDNLFGNVISFHKDTVTSSTGIYYDAPNKNESNGLRDYLIRNAKHLSSNSEELRAWQAAKELDLMPLVVLNALYMLIGVVGNSTVCYVCAVRMPRTVLNNFVLSLAMAELLGCVLIIPLEITKNMNAYDFDFPGLCKAEKYLRSFVIFFTNCILIAIATERYQRIVKPHNRHVTAIQFRMTVAGSILFATIAAIPEAVLSGSQKIETQYGDGVVCSTYSSDSYAGTVFPPLWACFVVLVYVISTAAIGSIYYVIAVTIWKRGKLQTDRRPRPNTPDLTLRRRVQTLDPNNHPSTMYLPHHHSVTSASDLYSKGEHRSLDRYDLGPVIRHNSDAGILNTTRSSSDEFKVQADVHLSVNHIDCAQNESDEENEPIISPLLQSFTKSSCFLFGEHDYDQQQETDKEEEDKKQYSLDLECSSFTITQQDSASDQYDTLDSILSKSDTQEKSMRCIEEDNRLREDRGFNLKHHPQEKQHQQQQSEQKRKERRRFTAVFFDELYQTVSRRRQRRDPALFQRQRSTDDILTPPPLSPMGSIRSRSGYSRKRTTFIMFVMTTTTAISLFPHIVVLLYSLAHPAVELRLSPDSSVVFHVAWNSFFISLACHPYVYGFWNGRFKKALISLFYGLREKAKNTTLRNNARDEDCRDNISRIF